MRGSEALISPFFTFQKDIIVVSRIQHLCSARISQNTEERSQLTHGKSKFSKETKNRLGLFLRFPFPPAIKPEQRVWLCGRHLTTAFSSMFIARRFSVRTSHQFDQWIKTYIVHPIVVRSINRNGLMG